MSNTKQRILTIVEGRKENQRIIDDFKKATKERGWGLAQILALNSDRLARYDLSDTPLDYVVFRNLTGNNYTEAERLLAYLRKKHSIVINSKVTGARACTSDKHFQQGIFLLDPILKEYALPTYEAKSKGNVMSYIHGKRVSFPIVLKERYGTTGKGIHLVKNESELDQIQKFNNLIIEQYVKADCDWRVFVIGGAAVGIMRKSGNPDHPEDFIAWSAGYTRSIEKDEKTIEELSRIACRAAAVSGLEYTGVDIIRDNTTKKYHILETNFAAGWMNFIPVTKINIPDLVIDWFEDRAEIGKKPTSQLVEEYIEKRKQYLSRKTRDYYDRILKGEKGIIKKIENRFNSEDDKYLYDTGYIFKKLASAYENITTSKNKPDYEKLIAEIETMPLSWTGNFIGPKVGTLEDGAILSAFYLFLVGKTRNL